MEKSDFYSDYQLPTSFKSSRQFRTRKKYDKFVDKIDITVKKLFQKQVEITNNNYKLPNPNDMFSENTWSIDDLQKMKNELNKIKNTLSDYNPTEWRNHTRKTNIAEDIRWRLKKDINPELFTQAWCKFYEIASSFPLIPEEVNHTKQLRTIHLCEAPGAFVTSFNHWLKTNIPYIEWDWRATTLNPYYEGNSLCSMINDDRFILHNLDHWYFGIDNTGDIMNIKNLDMLIDLEKDNSDKIMLITADGSVDCMDMPGEQEITVSHLHFCEVVTALHLLSTNGTLLLKLFTFFECQTISLMYFLTCCFDKIIIKKPATSKPGNSEIYLICSSFRGREEIKPCLNILKKYYETGTTLAMIRKNDIPHSFIEQIVECANYFKSFQCKEILNNMKLFESINNDDFYLKRLKSAVTNYYIGNFKLRKLPPNMEIGGVTMLNQSYSTLNNKSSHDSYNERQKKINMTALERFSILRQEIYVNIVRDNYSYQFTNEYVDLQLSVGRTYLKIKNSKFCDSKMFNCYDSAIEISNLLKLEWFYPDKNSTTMFITNNRILNYLLFQYNLVFDNYNTVKKIYDMIIRLEDQQTLVLIGYSLLTQFNVGILYFLSHLFKCVTMQALDDLGCIITLENYCTKDYMIKNLEDTLEALKIAKNNNQDIISVIPITTLFADKIYQMVIDMNHSIIKDFIIYVGRSILK